MPSSPDVIKRTTRSRYSYGTNDGYYYDLERVSEPDRYICVSNPTDANTSSMATTQSSRTRSRLNRSNLCSLLRGPDGNRIGTSRRISTSWLRTKRIRANGLEWSGSTGTPEKRGHHLGHVRISELRSKEDPRLLRRLIAILGAAVLLASCSTQNDDGARKATATHASAARANHDHRLAWQRSHPLEYAAQKKKARAELAARTEQGRQEAARRAVAQRAQARRAAAAAGVAAKHTKTINRSDAKILAKRA